MRYTGFIYLMPQTMQDYIYLVSPIICDPIYYETNIMTMIVWLNAKLYIFSITNIDIYIFSVVNIVLFATFNIYNHTLGPTIIVTKSDI